MNTAIKISFLNLAFLAVQALYMYLSSKTQLKNGWWWYLIAVPIVMVFPPILNAQGEYVYELYEYAVIFCIMAAAVIDITYSAAVNKNYMTDEKKYMFLYAFLLICTAVVWLGGADLLLKRIVTIFTICVIVARWLTGKHSAKELVYAFAYMAVSVACSWGFVNFVL